MFYSVTVHGINNIKMIDSKKARIINHYKNMNEKLFKTNAKMCFNKMCRLNHLTPKYMHIKCDANNIQNTRINGMYNCALVYMT
jgi:hypothetical protein